MTRDADYAFRMRISDEVGDALLLREPVVALESTIIAHGLPYPDNLECARETERVVREAGAVPATIAVLGGLLRVGLDADEIEGLATKPDVPKASRRDLGVLLARGSDGATTVAGTMFVAAQAGIDLFATGGIGGVHRGASESFDVSADLMELARTDVTVVCAGVKSLLDIGLTLEVLETHGVPVLGYRSDAFPAFYASDSGYVVDARCETPDEIADVVRARRDVGMRGGVLVANPIAEQYELDASQLEAWVDAALADAERSGVRGPEVTPFALERIHELSGGASAEANKRLVYSNAAVAAMIARAICEAA
jgi:pseudouridine-5'-phosphate glycosidase